jgi:hypothetical protein
MALKEKLKMFTTLKTPQDYFNLTTKFFESVPKTPADAKVAFEKVQAVLETEKQNSLDMWKIYQKAATGDATVNEISEANKKAAELLKATTFATVIAMPGSLLILPLLIESAKKYDIDLVPKSVAKEFNI